MIFQERPESSGSQRKQKQEKKKNAEKQKSKKNEGEKVTRRKGIFMPEYEMVCGILS